VFIEGGSGKGPSASVRALLGNSERKGPLPGNRRLSKGRPWRREPLGVEAQLDNLDWSHLPVTLRDR